MTLCQILAMLGVFRAHQMLEVRERLEHLLSRELFKVRLEFGEDHRGHKLGTVLAFGKPGVFGQFPRASAAGSTIVFVAEDWRRVSQGSA